jgi:hypothetical protein
MHVPPPERGDDGYERDHPFEAVTPLGYPFAFSNPVLLDRGGDGFQGVRK